MGRRNVSAHSTRHMLCAPGHTNSQEPQKNSLVYSLFISIILFTHIQLSGTTRNETKRKQMERRGPEVFTIKLSHFLPFRSELAATVRWTPFIVFGFALRIASINKEILSSHSRRRLVPAQNQTLLLSLFS